MTARESRPADIVALHSMTLASPARTAHAAPLGPLAALVALAALAAPAASAQPPDSTRAPRPLAAPLVGPLPAGVTRAAADTVPRRPRAVDVASAYDRRLAIHRWGSYAMLPLFAAQYVLGERLLEQKEGVYSGRRREPIDEGLRDAHLATAVGVGAVFAVNTVTGVWNLVDSREVAEGKTRRAVHAIAMLAADAGFLATGLVGRDAVRSDVDRARAHRNVALASVGVATVSAAAMLILNRD